MSWIRRTRWLSGAAAVSGLVLGAGLLVPRDDAGAAAGKAPLGKKVRAARGAGEDAGKGAAEIAAGAVVQGTLEPGDGRLADDGSFFDVWMIEAEAGELLTVTMRSEEFDPLLLLAPLASPMQFIDVNDDVGPEDTNARLVVEIPETGRYLILANAYAGDQSGRYELGVQSEPPLEFTGGGDAAGRYALLVGIDDYPGDGEDLRGPVADAALVKDLLVERYGFPEENVLVLLDKRATRRNLARAIETHLGQAGEDGLAFFFYSGHGLQLEANEGIRPPLDAEPNGVDEALYLSDGDILLDDEVGWLTDRLGAGRVVVAIDSCFSGGAARGGGQPKGLSEKALDVLYAKRTEFLVGPQTKTASAGGLFAEKGSRVVMTASSDEQLSWTASEWPDLPGPASVFTYYFVKQMQAAPAEATFAEAMEAVTAYTSAFARQSYGEDQTPTTAGKLVEERIEGVLKDAAGSGS